MWKAVSESSSVWNMSPHPTFNLVFLISLVVVTLSSYGHALPLIDTLATSNNQGVGRAAGGGGPSSDVASSTSSLGMDFAQMQNLFREVLKYVHKMNKVSAAEEPQRVHGISGQVNVRYPRSEVGDMALIRLVALQDLDRKFGAKARPRFGKRNEVTQDNFIPIYGDEDQQQSRDQNQLGVKGDRQLAPPPQSPPLFFLA